jgi:CubicO group peptidase (beta-lactamase class C family)/polyisoprenoid-binding protein YceI
MSLRSPRRTCRPASSWGGKTLADVRAGTYTVDPDHCAVFARVSHIGYSWSVFRFDRASGKLTFDPAAPAKSTLSAAVVIESITSNVKGFASELAGEQYLKAAKFPEATFVSTAFRRSDDTHGKVDGQLTLMGIGKPVTFDVELVGVGKGWAEKPRMGVRAVARIKPQDSASRRCSATRSRSWSIRVREGAMNVALQPATHELELTRELKARRERVFSAWTDPEQAVRWWMPQDWTLVSCRMDVRPGGGWHRRMRGRDGSIVTKWGEYREIASPERLVFTYNTELADGTVEAETLVTVTFDDLGGRTRLTLRHAAFQSGARASATPAAGPARWSGSSSSRRRPEHGRRRIFPGTPHAAASRVGNARHRRRHAGASWRWSAGAARTWVEAVGTQSFDGAPMRRDTIFRIASMTKPVIAAATLMLVEECRLRLDDPVDGFLPELADRQVLKSLESAVDDTVPAKRSITARDLLTFTFGMGAVMVWPARYPIQKAAADLGLAPGPFQPDLTADAFMKRLGTLPLVYQPGERWLYHTGSDVLGVLIARVSGQPLEAFLRERLFAPLGMYDTGFQVTQSKLHRLASAYMMDPQKKALGFFDDAKTSRWSKPPAFAAGGSGLVSTVETSTPSIAC